MPETAPNRQSFPSSAREPSQSTLSRLKRRLRSDRYVVFDRSMEPTFLPGDRLLVDPVAFRERLPRVGEIVVLQSTLEQSRPLLKRVGGVAHDHLLVLRDGVLRTQPKDTTPGPFAPSSPPGALEELSVPAGHLFVLSDALSGGRDSRHFGPVPVAELLGQPWYRYAPRSRRGPV